MTAEMTNIACAERLGITPGEHEFEGDERWMTCRECGLAVCLTSSLEHEMREASKPCIPNFHGSMDDAMRLVEKAKEMGWIMKLTNEWDHAPWTCKFQRVSDKYSFEVDAPTPSAAICAAFLKLPLP